MSSGRNPDTGLAFQFRCGKTFRNRRINRSVPIIPVFFPAFLRATPQSRMLTRVPPGWLVAGSPGPAMLSVRDEVPGIPPSVRRFRGSQRRRRRTRRGPPPSVRWFRGFPGSFTLQDVDCAAVRPDEVRRGPGCGATRRKRWLPRAFKAVRGGRARRDRRHSAIL